LAGLGGWAVNASSDSATEVIENNYRIAKSNLSLLYEAIWISKHVSLIKEAGGVNVSGIDVILRKKKYSMFGMRWAIITLKFKV
jgi:hypothetical protein